MPLADGQAFAGYTIVRRLGAGAMGEVYLAEHPRLPRRDALKVLPTDVSADDEYRRRFELEADIAAALWHPHIVTVHDRGEHEDLLWISMDYVEGTDAAQLLAEHYPQGMPPNEVIRIVTAVADALDHAHQRELLHRDVKPANILLAGADSERILLADFGIARRLNQSSGLTGTDMTVGTVAYAAPEQLKAEAIDGRADQYALAATAFQLLTGEPPFRHSNPAVVISQHLTAEPPAIGDRRPELSELSPVFAKALAKDPADRYNRCIDFARALDHAFGSAEQHPGVADATMLAVPSSGPDSTKRRRRLVISAAAALVVLAAGAGGYVLLSDGPDQPTPAAEPTGQLGAPTVPVVVVGADCATLGAAGTTEDGDRAYCAHLPSVDADIWSLVPGRIDHPTVTPDPGEPVFAPHIETPVRVCVEQTDQSRLECHEAILMENTDPDADAEPS